MKIIEIEGGPGTDGLSQMKSKKETRRKAVQIRQAREACASMKTPKLAGSTADLSTASDHYFYLNFG